MTTDTARGAEVLGDEGSRRYARWLWLLAAIFAVRVVAQPLALQVESGVLPRFDSWHSETLPYPVLVLFQLLILAWLIRTARSFSAGAVVPSRRTGLVALIVGDLYLTLMLLRLVLGATVLSHNRWFASPLPTVFHLVLAAFLLLVGWFHFRNSMVVTS